MSWSPGDIAIVRGCANAPEVNGHIVHITSHPYQKLIRDNWKMTVDIEPIKGHAAANVRLLHPVPDEPGSWEDCVWRPSEIEAAYAQDRLFA